MADLAKLVVKLEAQTAQYVQQLDLANKKLDKFTKTQEITLGGAAKKFAALGVAAAVGIGAMVKKSIDAADHLRDLSQSTGVSTESLSKLAFAAQQSGGDLESVAVGMKKLNLSVAEAAGNIKSEAAIAFNALGISVKDANGNLRSADEVIKDVADRFSTFQDGANKTAIATTLFSKTGASLIPMLNEGAAGLNEMGEKAEKAGAVLSGESADAADKFNDKLGELKLLMTGFGIQVMEKLLPALTNLIDKWDLNSEAATAMGTAVEAVVNGFKVAVSIGIGVAAVFQLVGKAIGAIVAAQVAWSKGDIKGTWIALKEGGADAVDTVSNAIRRIDSLFSDVSGNLDEYAIKAKRYKFEPPNLAGIKAAQEAAAEAAKKVAAATEAARKKLDGMNDSLKEQVETFGMGEAAMTEYQLTTGLLKAEVEAAGESGLKLRDSIIEQANALEKLNTQQALYQIDQQILELLGHTEEAAVATFDLANQMLKASLIKMNNEDGLARLEQLRALTIAQAQYNEEEDRRQEILGDLQKMEDRIQHSQEVGAINELEALNQLDTARKKAADQLDSIAAKQMVIAENSKNPELIKNAEAAAVALEDLRRQTDLLGQKIRSTFEDIGGDALASFLDRSRTAKEAVKDFIGSLEKQIADFVAKDLMRKLMNGIFGAQGGTGGGTGGGWLSTAATFLGSIFGGSRDSGGKGQPGKAYKIGTGAQPEIFMPSSHGEFIPATQMGGGGGMQITQHFHFTSPTDRRTQTQVAAKAGSGVQNAQRRNG